MGCKYYKQKKQVYLNGVWVDAGEYRKGGLYEYNSPDCGIVSNNKFEATYTSGRTFTIECNLHPGESWYDATILYWYETAPDGYLHEDMLSGIIGNCVETIGEQAFEGCSGITTINIPNSVTTIEELAFAGCSRLSTLNSNTEGEYKIPSSVTSIGIGAFNANKSLIRLIIPDSVTTIGNQAFIDCSGMTSCTLGSGITAIDDFTFYECSGMTSINIPSGVTSIGEQAFRHCKSLTSMVLPNGLTTIEEYAFGECSGLTSINIPSGVTTINRGILTRCTGLTSVIIPSGVTSIGCGAFWGCTHLNSITCLATTPPTIEAPPSYFSDYKAFNNTNNCQIYVPSNRVTTYKNASGWSEYSSRIRAIPT